jgi:hypothetical protein
MESFTPVARAASAARQANLQRAHEVRSARARVKRAVAAGTMTVDRALNEPCCQTMRVVDLLHSQPKWGSVRTLRTLRGLRIGEDRLVGELTERRRMLITRATSGEGGT